jgi:hypothetical protein
MKPSLGKTIVAVATTLVVVSIIAGVILVGSPAQGRLQRLDAGRVEDLRGIMLAMDLFWTHHERLPASLDELMEDPRVQVNTVDPGSADSYEYYLLDEDTYELCAIFDRESLAPARRAPADFWSHGVGRRCFELSVDTSGRGADRQGIQKAISAVGVSSHER